MKTKISGIMVFATLVTTSFAHSEDLNGLPPGTRNGENLRKEYREERKGNIEEMKGKMMDARESFKEDMQARKEWAMSSSTSSSTKPTPWKNIREELKEIKKGFRDDMKDTRQDFRSNVVLLNATATTAIATKLGLTSEALKSQVASGTSLKDLFKKASLTKEEIKAILPPPVVRERIASSTGIFARFFGPRKEIVTESYDDDGELREEVRPQSFFRRFFGF